ncbi:MULTISPECIES: hypothetical protein [unclassified Amycolatopsis]|uniref:hypothetical protein n=1 Tax=unclassified Amycolatopsis TaxID=2618356 RepID=UPI001C699EE3|nr:hypothetical protein [Amycolatopsis sp. DSM 110486]QYN21475.1 hypothetical protein K1T34_02670 [Amycolatopsis sp. DSM 110486]
MGSRETPHQRFFREDQLGGSYTPLGSGTADAGTSPDGPAFRARTAGFITILPPIGRRPWTANWSEERNGEILDMFEADTFDEASAWSFEQTTEVFIRQETGELVRAERPKPTR